MYYPPVISASTAAQYPFNVPTADISISLGLPGAQSFYSAIGEDDIVRLQTSLDGVSWQDLFEGRIIEIRQLLGGNRSLHCRSHVDELAYRMPTSQYSGLNVTTGTILNSLCGSYLDRLSVGSIDTSNSTSVTDYKVDGWKKYLADVVHEMEEIEGYGYRLQTNPTYNSDDTLASVSLDWQPIDTDAMVTPVAIEDTKRVNNAEFVTSIAKLYNNVKVFGNAVSATASDSTSITDYNTRMHSIPAPSATTTDQCQEYADADINNLKLPVIRGTIDMIGTCKINPGDYIYCKFPSIYHNGAFLDGKYQIMQVTDNISSSGWKQYIEVGDLYSSSGLLISVLQKQLRLASVGLT